MEIKVGKKLWCKGLDCPYYHKKDDIVVVISIRERLTYPIYIKFGKEDEYYTFKEIEECFYDKAEWREQQINSILNGD